MNRKKVFITGITGFAGSHLAELLNSENKFDIFGTHVSDRHLDNLDRIKESVNLYKVNLLNSQDISKAINIVKPEIIYHLAASTSVTESFANPTDMLMNNIMSQVNLLEAVKNNNLKIQSIIITSSSHVYGNVSANDLPIDEDVKFRPDNPYSVSKITQDYLGLSYFLAYKLPIVVLRPFNHIGPRLSPSISVSRFARAIALIEKGNGEPILKVGNLDAKRDFTDVHDMVRAYLLALDHCTPGEVYNIGTGKSYSIREILDILLSLSVVKISVESDKSLFRPSDIPELRCNSDKFKRTTGWVPEALIENTLQDILDYWRKVI